MCGIIGIVGARSVAPLLLDGLRRLEYRGYDSAGMASLVDGYIERRRAEGKIARLAERLDLEPLGGVTGIGHTRWATHGRPTEVNAHPHMNGRLALVHNGIIENHRELREELEAIGYRFETETDTETVVHLVGHNLDQGMEPAQAVSQALHRLEGAFAFAMIFAGHHNLMIGARRGSPLAVGYGDESELYLGSDALALAPLTNRICYLEEGDWVVLQDGKAQIYDADHEPVERPVVQSALSGAAIGKGNFRHFMQKEIHEQPSVIGDTLHTYVNLQTREVTLPELPVDLATLPRLTISACGTAYYAGFVAKYWLEQIARLPVELDIASEFRYREAPMPERGAAMFISQSGETIDTLAALRYARDQKQSILSVVNQPESAIARESDLVLPTLAGPEIGVASTKAFTTQLTVLACFSLATACARGAIDAATEARLTTALTEVPAAITQVLEHTQMLEEIAQEFVAVHDVLYLGRGSMFPLALEGALKLKEISYIHAEGYAAGELKHGPIALIDEHVPIVVAAPSGPLFDKLASNVQETIARGGRVIIFSDKAGLERVGEGAAHMVEMPELDPFVAPILYAVPMQLLAYYTAVAKGTDVDQPRNLAKSVTVE
jgi:glucosamine--fructose-6-phosphate aminotransferase (isomerizing)